MDKQFKVGDKVVALAPSEGFKGPGIGTVDKVDSVDRSVLVHWPDADQVEHYRYWWCDYDTLVRLADIPFTIQIGNRGYTVGGDMYEVIGHDDPVRCAGSKVAWTVRITRTTGHSMVTWYDERGRHHLNSDPGRLLDLLPPTNRPDAVNALLGSTKFKVGDRVEYAGTTSIYQGAKGVVVETQGDTLVAVRFYRRNGTHNFHVRNLRHAIEPTDFNGLPNTSNTNQEETCAMRTAPKIETKLFITTDQYGTSEASKLTDEQLLAEIERCEAEIQRLEGLNAQPKAVVHRIAELGAGIKAIVEYMDKCYDAETAALVAGKK